MSLAAGIRFGPHEVPAPIDATIAPRAARHAPALRPRDTVPPLPRGSAASGVCERRSCSPAASGVARRTAH